MRFRLAAFSAVLSIVAAAPAFAYRVSVWVPPWTATALTSVQTNGAAITESNPVWYSWAADGTILKNWNAENPTWRAAMTGSLLIPTIQNVVDRSYNPAAVANMLAAVVTREAHAAAVAQLAAMNAFDGIDIDYESIPTASRADFTAFLSTLSLKLHAAGKKLSVTVHAKTSDAQNWNGPGAEDWRAIGQLADSVKIMAYDYSHSESTAGPVTPLDWLDRVATYAESVIPAQKIMMGLPWYGYDWVGAKGTGATYASAVQVAQNRGIAIGRDAASGEATYSYDNHTVFFQDSISYSRKVELLKQKHSSIGGFAHWAAGTEDPETWKVIRSGASSSGTSGGSTAAGDFVISSPATLSLVQGTEASADLRILSINGFNAAANVSLSTPAGFAGRITVDSTLVTAATGTTIRVAAGLNTAPGTYPLVVHFTSGSLVHEATIGVVVTQAQINRVRVSRK